MFAVFGRVSALLLVAVFAGCNSSAPMVMSAALAYSEPVDVWGDFPIDASVNYYVVNQIVGAKSDLPDQLSDALEDQFGGSFAAKSLNKKKLHEIEELIKRLRPTFPYDGEGAHPENQAWGQSAWIAKVFESGEVEVMRISFTEDGLVVIQTSSLLPANSSVSQLPSDQTNGQAARTIVNEAYYEDAGGELLRSLEALAPRQRP